MRKPKKIEAQVKEKFQQEQAEQIKTLEAELNAKSQQLKEFTRQRPTGVSEITPFGRPKPANSGCFRRFIPKTPYIYPPG